MTLVVLCLSCEDKTILLKGDLLQMFTLLGTSPGEQLFLTVTRSTSYTSSTVGRKILSLALRSLPLSRVLSTFTNRFRTVVYSSSNILKSIADSLGARSGVDGVTNSLACSADNATGTLENTTSEVAELEGR